MLKELNAAKQDEGDYLTICRIINKLQYFDIRLFYLKKGEYEGWLNSKIKEDHSFSFINIYLIHAIPSSIIISILLRVGSF